MLLAFTLTAFLGAALLFLVQPMFARMALPVLGGSPAVWNTALVFFQVTLLAGYAYAHFATARLGVRRQALLHVLLVVAAFVALPIAVPTGWSPPTDHSPVLWLLGLLAARVGPPFFVISATGPLVQRWLGGTEHRSARDPYFLYAASNAGSMLGLLGYPVLLEPWFRLADQSRLWTAGYAVLVVLLIACVVMTRRSLRGPSGGASAAETSSPPIAWRRRLRWVLLAFVPSSLMMGVTMHLSTDIMAVPLLWVVPLAVYLLSFILVFARRPPIAHATMVRALPLVLLPLVMVMQARVTQPLALIVAMHLLVLFVAAMVAHGELAKDRPDAARLTEFYLWLSAGGALGGAFNSLVAPLVFRSVAEYPISLVLACLAMPLRLEIPAGRRERLLDLLVPVLFGAAVVLFVLVARITKMEMTPLAVLLLFAALAFPLLASSRRPVRFGLALGVLWLLNPAGIYERSRAVYAQRSFFGVSRVMWDGSRRFHEMIHGTTLHGLQRFAPRACDEPLGYYYGGGPIGDIFRVLDGRAHARRVAVTGLGAGSLAPYARAGDRWTFYEIDPTVRRIACDTSCFCYLASCRGEVRIVLGDARRSLAATEDRYDLIVLDAYSSDVIPVHLITREALRLYLDRLAPHGLLVFHISNRYFDLAPVVARLAEEAHLVCRLRDDAGRLTARQEADGLAVSACAVLARSVADLGELSASPRWIAPRARNGLRVWTDDFSSPLSVLRR